MKLTFVKKQHEVGDVWSYFFMPSEDVIFQPGQYLNLTMPDVPPAVADRIFTIASAPHEAYLQFTSLLGESLFKQKLNSLNEGEVVEADQLGGDFVWQDSTSVSNSTQTILVNKRLIFIAGGIGVTPFLSIIRDRLYKQLPINASLLYAGRDDRRPFWDELLRASELDSTFDIKEYSGIRLTLARLQADIPDINSSLVYLAGSQVFSETLGEVLIESGHDRSQIKYDYFDGYQDIEY